MRVCGANTIGLIHTHTHTHTHTNNSIFNTKPYIVWYVYNNMYLSTSIERNCSINIMRNGNGILFDCMYSATWDRSVPVVAVTCVMDTSTMTTNCGMCILQWNLLTKNTLGPNKLICFDLIERLSSSQRSVQNVLEL